MARRSGSRSRSRGGSGKGTQAFIEILVLLIFGVIQAIFGLLMSASESKKPGKGRPTRRREDPFDQDLDRDHVLDYPQNGRHGMDFDRSSRSED